MYFTFIAYRGESVICGGGRGGGWRFCEWHGLINYIDNKAKCRHLKNLPVRDLAAGVYQSL